MWSEILEDVGEKATMESGKVSVGMVLLAVRTLSEDASPGHEEEKTASEYPSPETKIGE